MATGSLILNPEAGVPADGSDAANAAPGFVRLAGSETSPHKSLIVAAFDATADEHLWFKFVMPADYASGNTLDIHWMVDSTTAANVVWGSKLGALTPGDPNTVLAKSTSTAVTGTTAVITAAARRPNSTTLTLNMDSAAAGDLIFLVVYRDADNASDTCTVDVELVSARFSYTTS